MHSRCIRPLASTFAHGRSNRPMSLSSKYQLRRFASHTPSNRRGGRILRMGSSLLGVNDAILRWAFVGLAGAAVGIGLYPYTVRRFTDRHSWWKKEESKPSSGTNSGILDGYLKNHPVDTEKKDVDEKPWHGLHFLQSSLPVRDVASTISSWTWPESLTSIQAKTSALILELSRGPGSLYSQIIYDPPDPDIHPECQWDAEVRIGDDLCLSERAFLRERRRKMRGAFARMFGVDESEIDERDLPIVAIAGSGGGYRAMMNTTGSLVGAMRSGLLDCVTYMAGISGSCWALGALYSGVAGEPTPLAAAEHLKDRITTSYVDMSALDMLITPPTNKYLLYGLIRKASSPNVDVSLTDLYGTLVSARLFVPSDSSNLDPRFMSLYHFKNYVDDASLPLPIFTAVRHEVPVYLEKPLAEAKDSQTTSVDSDKREESRKQQEAIEDISQWLWFEFTPYEVGCDELGAWIPSWSLGRQFNNGKSLDNAPEVSFSILAGIFASAFCASLHHYFNEIQPLLRQLPSQLFSWLEEIVQDNDRDLSTIHPVLPNELPNFVKGMAGQLRENSPPDITERDTLGFMDAGAELNIPYYPLFRRDVDCIIALDASADSQDLWFTRAEKYAARRGLQKWPKGAHWPALLEATAQAGAIVSHVAVEGDTDAANRRLAEAQESEVVGQAEKRGDAEQRARAQDGTKLAGTPRAKAPDISSADDKPAPHNSMAVKPLNACTIWIGSSTGSQESSRMDDLEGLDLLERDGIAVVYNPLIPNDAVPDFDPMSISTWTFKLEKDETEKLLKVAEANFIEGQEKIVKLLKGIWQRKRAERKKLQRMQRGTRVPHPLHHLDQFGQ